MNDTAALPESVTITPDFPASEWAVTSVEHPAVRDFRPVCPECMKHAESAAVHARVTGSRGATYGDGTHGATVARLIATVSL